jgi:hypothetical protein
MPNGTYGGVGGRRERSRLLPDSIVGLVLKGTGFNPDANTLHNAQGFSPAGCFRPRCEQIESSDMPCHVCKSLDPAPRVVVSPRFNVPEKAGKRRSESRRDGA